MAWKFAAQGLTTVLNSGSHHPPFYQHYPSSQVHLPPYLALSVFIVLEVYTVLNTWTIISFLRSVFFYCNSSYISGLSFAGTRMHFPSHHSYVSMLPGLRPQPSSSPSAVPLADALFWDFNNQPKPLTTLQPSLLYLYPSKPNCLLDIST